MSDERRYRDEEIEQIFGAASAPRPPGGPATTRPQGLTLRELQEIGSEVGVSPERIAEEASALDRRQASLPARTHLGMPISVGRSVPISRFPTDREWSILLGEIRDTFRARGKDRSQEGTREWSNGNLNVRIEPTDGGGYRLRMGTLKSDGPALTQAGLIVTLIGLYLLARTFLFAEAGDDLLAAALLLLGGPTAIGYNAVRLQRWTRERDEQMDYIAARAQALLDAGDRPDL